MSSGGTPPATTARRNTRRSIRSTRTTSRGCASPGGGRRSTPSLLAANRRCACQQLPLDADHGRRRALCVERRRPGRGVRSGDGPDDLGAAGAARASSLSRQRQSRRRVLGRGRRRRASSRSATSISTRSIARPANRSRSSATAAVSISRPPRAARSAYSLERPAAGRPRRRGAGVVDGRAGLGGQDEGVPGDVSATTCAPASCGGRSVRSHARENPAIETWESESWRYTGAGNVWAPMSARR